MSSFIISLDFELFWGVSESRTVYSILLSNIYKPTLFMLSDNMAHSSILKTCLKLPVKRQFPFFVSTWIKDDGFDMSGITLAASDF